MRKSVKKLTGMTCHIFKLSKGPPKVTNNHSQSIDIRTISSSTKKHSLFLYYYLALENSVPFYANCQIWLDVSERENAARAFPTANKLLDVVIQKSWRAQKTIKSGSNTGRRISWNQGRIIFLRSLFIKFPPSRLWRFLLCFQWNEFNSLNYSDLLFI